MSLAGFITLDTDTPSKSGLYVTGLPGVTLAQIDGLTKDEQSDVEDTFEYLYALAQTNLKIDVQRALAKRFHIDLKLASRETSKFLDEANTSDELAGVTIEFDLPKYAKLHIPTIGVYQLSPNFVYKPSTGGTQYNAITYGDGLFLRGSGNSVTGIQTSVDGLIWTTRTTPNLGTIISGIAYGAEIYVAVHQTAGVTTTAVMTSPDGITWTTRTTPSAAVGFAGIIFAGGQFVIFGQSGVSISDDGITWSAMITIASPVAGSWSRIAYDAEHEKYIIITSSGNDYLVSSDAENWYHAPSMGDFTDNPIDIVYGNGTLLICGNSGNFAISKDGGDTWEKITSSIIPNFGWTALGYGGGVFIASALDGDPDNGDGDTIAVSSDGRQWSAVMEASDEIRGTEVPIIFNEDRFVWVASGSGGASAFPHVVVEFQETAVRIYEDDADGDLLGSYSIDALNIGSKTVEVDDYFEVDKLFIAFEPNSNFRKSENRYYPNAYYNTFNKLSCTFPCYGQSASVTQVNGGGLNVKFIVFCSIEKLIEENISLFQYALWYRIGVDLMIEARVSDRVTRFTVLSPERAVELMEVFNTDYQAALEAATMNIKMQEDPVCFLCKRPIQAVTSLP